MLNFTGARRGGEEGGGGGGLGREELVLEPPEQRGNNVHHFQDVYLKTKAIPVLYVPHSLDCGTFAGAGGGGEALVGVLMIIRSTHWDPNVCRLNVSPHSVPSRAPGVAGKREEVAADWAERSWSLRRLISAHSCSLLPSVSWGGEVGLFISCTHDRAYARSGALTTGVDQC